MFRIRLPKLRAAASKCSQTILGQGRASNGRPAATTVTTNRPWSPSSRAASSRTNFSRSEVRACYELFRRSDLLDPSSPKFVNFWSSVRVSACQFHSSSNDCQSSQKDNPNKEEPDPKKGKCEPLLSVFNRSEGGSMSTTALMTTLPINSYARLPREDLSYLALA